MTTTLLIAILTHLGPLEHQDSDEVLPPQSITTEGFDSIPGELERLLRPYRSSSGFGFGDWFSSYRQILVRAGAEPAGQVFSVVNPGAVPHRLTRFNGRVLGAVARPGHNQFVILYDRAGEERVQLALFDTKTGSIIRLTDGVSRHSTPVWSPEGQRLAFTSDARNQRDYDLYLIEPDSPNDSPQFVLPLQGLTTVEDWSADGRRVLIHSVDSSTGIQIYEIDLSKKNATLIAPRPEDWGVHSPASPRWEEDQESILMSVYRGGQYRELARLRLEPRAWESVGNFGDRDLETFQLSSNGRWLAVTVHDQGYSRLIILDPKSGTAIRRPPVPDGQITDLVYRPNAEELGFTLATPTGASHAYSYLLKTGVVVRWTRGRPGGPRFVVPPPPERFRYRTFDGRMIPAHITRPDTQRFKGPRPVLVDLHGGPRAQARPSFLGPDAYLISEFGMTLVVPNVRGSTGFGLAYMGLDDREHREDAVRDVGALLDWIETQPDLDPARVVLRGGSYGGYLVLASLVRFGERIAAGIDIAGISSFETLMADQPPLRLNLLRLEFGDERSPETQAFFRAISPLTHADQIKTPLLVVQGANDPRVPVREARQIVDAVRANGVPVWYLLASDEGHGYSRAENREFLRLTEAYFIYEHLRKSREQTLD